MTKRDLVDRARRRLKQYDADFISEDELSDWIDDEIRDMPPQLFKLGFDTSLTTQTTNNEYTIPSGVDKVLEFWYKDSDGNYSNEMKIKRQLAGTVFLSNICGDSGKGIRLYVRKPYTVPSTETATMDIEDNKIMIILYGIMATAFDAAAAYSLDKETYRSKSEPESSGVSSLNRIAAYYRNLKAVSIRKAMPPQYARNIDLVNN